MNESTSQASKTGESLYLPTNVSAKTAIPDKDSTLRNRQVRFRSCSSKRYPRVVLLMSLLSRPAFCQKTEPADSAPPELEVKRVLWIIANFSTSPSLAQYKPLTPREKFRNCDPGACLVQGDDRKPKSDTSHHRGMLYEIARLGRSGSLVGL